MVRRVKRFWKGIAARLGVDPRPAPPTLQAPPTSAPVTSPAPISTPRPATPRPATPRQPVRRTTAPRPGPAATSGGDQAPHAPARGHRAAQRRLAYAPRLDGNADPGEVVWTWVRYEDDPHQGKDRPVLVVGREGTLLLGLMLSSQSERDGQAHWLALGPGAWDRQDRPSWVRLDRVLEVDENGIRREGAVLDRARFDSVARALRKGYGWA
jgi:hypothetical protein